MVHNRNDAESAVSVKDKMEQYTTIACLFFLSE